MGNCWKNHIGKLLLREDKGIFFVGRGIGDVCGSWGLQQPFAKPTVNDFNQPKAADQ